MTSISRVSSGENNSGASLPFRQWRIFGQWFVFFLIAGACAPVRQRPLLPVEISRNPYPVELSRITVAAAGDILMHGDVKKSAAAADKQDENKKSLNQNGYNELIVDIAPEFKKADLTFANLETPIAPKKGGGARSFVFNASTVVVESFKEMGVDVVSVANNHAYDQGRAGLLETISHLDNQGLYHVGAGRTKAEAQAPLLLDVGGIRLAMFGSTDIFNDNLNIENDKKEAVNEFNVADMSAAVKKIRDDVDLVIVSVHWGEEYKSLPAKKARNQATALFEAGVDVILGHHPHVLQPIETYVTTSSRTCFVVYSLGNFISNQSRFYLSDITPDAVGDTRDGAILFFDVVKRDYGLDIVKTELSQIRYVPIWTENDALTRKESAPPRIRVVSIDRTLEKLRALRDRLFDQQPADELGEKIRKEKYLAVVKDIQALYARREQIVNRLGRDFAVQKPFSAGGESEKKIKRILGK